MTGAVVNRLPDGRLHFQHGPIDLILGADGPEEALSQGTAAAARCFAGLLEGLVAELPALRSARPTALHGPVARAMAAAVAPHGDVFVTPMAAVAGAVADAVLAAFVSGAGYRLIRAHANNGGDIALWLGPDAQFSCAIATEGGLRDTITIRHTDRVRGIATSGWRGRSQSLGIADAVTVLARNAAEADVAATLIANAVDLPGHRAIARRPANALKAESDLGALPVTVAVGSLTAHERATALARGMACARAMRARGTIEAAALFLQGECRRIGTASMLPALPRKEPLHA